MAEPQPNNVTEGADPPDVVPASEEDRKAAQAMSSLDATTNDEAPKKEVDQEALSKALKDFEISQAPKKTNAGTVVKKEEAPKKIIKVDAADVALLVWPGEPGLERMYADVKNRYRLNSWMSVRRKQLSSCVRMKATL